MNDAARRVDRKDVMELAQEWDALAELRHQQISSGLDLSFRYVLAPLTVTLLRGANCNRLLDIGCGTGELTKVLAEVAPSVMGIDPSSRSLEIAVGVQSHDNVDFRLGTVESLGAHLAERRFSAAVAGMTLMTVADLRAFATAVASVLPPDARLVATITHPCFWPRYWSYEHREWFSYWEEIFVEAPFRISGEADQPVRMVSTHVHRPIEQYVSQFAEAGFILERITEPLPPPSLPETYLRTWKYPRFLGLRWRRA